MAADHRLLIPEPAAAIDRRLARAAEALDYILAVSPVDVEEPWRAFQAAGGRTAPEFRYRDLPGDLAELRAEVAGLRVEDVEDERVGSLLGRLREEIVAFCDLVAGRGTPSFRETSAALHGEVDAREAELAEAILDMLEGWHTADWSASAVDAEAFAAEARREIDRLGPDAADAGVELRDDIQGAMVMRGTLLVDSRYAIDPRRVQALIQHEVGTHIVTELNGRRQPLATLSAGLAGYEGTQEGLAVLAEHLVGGLTPQRMALLAGRVLAVRHLMEDRAFPACVDALLAHGFTPRGAFDVVVRVHRGGGLLKDAVYLRGLAEVLGYLRAGGRLDSLLVGKVSLGDAPVVAELIDDAVLQPPLLVPRWTEGLGDRRSLPADVTALAGEVLAADVGAADVQGRDAGF